MALTSGFFNSRNGDRVYDARQFSSMYDGLIIDGIYEEYQEAFAVTPGSDFSVNVGRGKAWFNNTWTLNDAFINIVLDPPPVSGYRCDAIVLEINTSEDVRKNSIKKIAGTLGFSYQKPTWEDTDDVHHYPLAYIYINGSTTAITDSEIENCIGTSTCPYAKLVNSLSPFGEIIEIQNGGTGNNVGYIQTGKASGSTIGECATAEGTGTQATARAAHAEGRTTKAYGESSHAEGYATYANGDNSHAEGGSTSANGLGAHAEGGNTSASGDRSHAEGESTTASGTNSHTEGYNTTASARCAHAEGIYSKATDECAHAEGRWTEATALDAHAEGSNTKATGNCSHAEGNNTTASEMTSHAEGDGTVASGLMSHAEGADSISSGRFSHAEGGSWQDYQGTVYPTKATGDYSHAEGKGTTASGAASHSEGMFCTATGEASHTSGASCHADGREGFSHGYNSHAWGDYSSCLGWSHMTGYAMTAVGYNSTAPGGMGWPAGSDTSYQANLGFFMVGCGINAAANCFRATETYTYGKSYQTSGADYAEMFEWEDENPKKEDRIGLFVTLDGTKIRFAKSTDDYILGVVSANPAVIGDEGDEWHYMYQTDIYGRYIYGKHYVPEEYDEEGHVISGGYYNDCIELNPDYDPDKPYIHRKDRPEWAIIGMLGKLVVIDDGTAVVNGYVYPGENGIATNSNDRTKFRVMERIDETHVRVLIL